jgi:hypothetical protein
MVQDPQSRSLVLALYSKAVLHILLRLKILLVLLSLSRNGNSIRRNCDLKQRNRKSPEETPIERVYYVAEICRIGEGKRVHQVEYLQDEQLIIALTGRQRQMRLIPIREAIHRIYLFLKTPYQSVIPYFARLLVVCCQAVGKNKVEYSVS